MNKTVKKLSRSVIFRKETIVLTIGLAIGFVIPVYVSGQTVIRVSTAEELVLCIEPGRTVVRDSLISEGTYGAVWIQEYTGIRFSGIEIAQNEAFTPIDIEGSTEVVFKNSWIGHNYGSAVVGAGRLGRFACTHFA